MRKLQIIIITIFFFLSPNDMFGQEDDALFTRLRGIVNKEISFFDVDGISITKHEVDVEFSAKNCAEIITILSKRYQDIAERFSKLNMEKIESELTTSDKELSFRNYYVYKSEEKPSNFFRNTAYYFVENRDKKLIIITFDYINKRDRGLERNFITQLYNNRIPESIYSDKSPVVESIDFVGRTISLPAKYLCKWKGVNNLQSFADGQMNWSIHKDLDDAKATLNNQFLLTSWKDGTEMVSDTTVRVIFEGAETTARKVVYRVTGIAGAMLKKDGGSDILNIYYVAAPVRNNYVSCVMSFWESDYINPSGLPFLLEQVFRMI